MRNLRNSRHDRLGTDQKAITTVAWDTTDDSILIATGPDEAHTITISRYRGSDTPPEKVQVASWDAPPPNPDISYDRILDLHCFPDTKSLCLILAGGDIVVVREDPQSGEDPVMIVGSVDAGIKAVSWSPDEEILALATGAGTSLLMTRDFESLASITLSAEDLQVSNHVSVGWGRKETQFKGRGVAKTLRDPTVPVHVDEGALSELDDYKTTISWRGDGQFVAINGVLEGKSDHKRRIIRVYSREGTLESASEPVNGLEGALSWRPSGQLIAGIRRQAEKADVVFFERNGLRHGEFSLRLTPDQLATIGSNIDLTWNTDSTVLAVSMKDRVQLWTMSNYHYYLKQEIRLKPEDMSMNMGSVVWHPEKPLQLACWSGTDLRNLAYNFEVCRGSVAAPHDLGLVAVIDGQKLKVTPLRVANIPPPMAFDKIELPDNCTDVSINQKGDEIKVLHPDGSTSTYICDYSVKPPIMAKLKSRTDHDRISHLDRLSTNVGIDGNASLTMGGVLDIHQGGCDLRISGCTSYIITSTHLIFSTTKHLLKFVHLGDMNVPPDEPEKDERCRSIERGAKIVTVMPSTYALVLQMPRGNLETIYPRALVLAGIRQSLKNRDYKKAFSTCRTQRVDMNILHDYAPKDFLADVGLFIKQVKKNDYIDLFISSLSEDDVSKTIYRETLPLEEHPLVNGHSSDNQSLDSTGSKVNRICDAFLNQLQKNSGRRLQNIVTAHVCKTPPDLESGLRLVSSLRVANDQEGLEQAVEHICFLADINQLYDTALGLYDLDVALLVAQQSQKDPREYLPYLQRLHVMSSVRQKFTIDHDLKRYSKALTHLHAIDAFDELKDYVIHHELYSTAIDLYRYDNSRLDQLMRLYADYLKSCNKYKDAGVAYEFIGDYSSALQVYRSAATWRQCAYNALLASIPDNEFRTVMEDLANELEESKRFSEAAILYRDYLDDTSTSVRLLCKAHEFSEAMRQVVAKGTPQLLKEVIDPGLIDGAASMTELLADMKSQLEAQVPRLRELRRKKQEDSMAFLDGAEAGDDVPDNISLAPTDASTSGGTFMTRYTNRSTGTIATNATRKTSKNRRREERKRAKGKKGTVYEEEYLLNSIGRLVDRLNDVGSDVSNLVEGLMRRAMRERAVAVQAAYDEVAQVAKACTDEVWKVEREGGADGEINPNATSRPWGGQGVLWDALTATRREAPIVKTFERSSLLL